ncbi:hypothetical protein CBL_20784 [Carabus blaptoides fortunei]
MYKPSKKGKIVKIEECTKTRSAFCQFDSFLTNTKYQYTTMCCYNGTIPIICGTYLTKSDTIISNVTI